MKHLIAMLNEKYTYEKDRLKLYGQECSMGKCAQSRIHLLDSIFQKMAEENLITGVPGNAQQVNQTL